MQVVGARSVIYFPLHCVLGGVQVKLVAYKVLRALPVPADRPAANSLANYRCTWKAVHFVNHAFERGVVIAAFLSNSIIVSCHRACLTYFFHPTSRENDAVFIIPQLITFSLRRPWRAGSIPTQPIAHRA